MEILQLRYFCDAAETENFSKTARKFLVPTSNISQSIKRLENELEVKLFDRASNRLKLNEQGRNFYIKINNALSIIDSAKKEILDDGISGKIKICILTNRRVVMQVAEKFRKLYPDVSIVINHSLADGAENFDIIIADDMAELKQMERRMISEEDISLAVKRGNELTDKKKITTEDMRMQSFISMNNESSLYRVTLAACKRMGFEPDIVIQSDDPFYIRRCVELGLGVAFVPTISWKGQFSDEIVIKKINGFKRITYAYSHSGQYTSKVTKVFLSMLIDEFKREMNTDM